MVNISEKSFEQTIEAALLAGGPNAPTGERVVRDRGGDLSGRGEPSARPYYDCFIQVMDVLDDKSRKTGEQALIFPRYHQLDTVRRSVADARTRGAGQPYLIQRWTGCLSSISRG